MGLTASSTGNDFKGVDPGTYAARCVKLIDLGTQHGEFEGRPRIRKQVLITWELPTELMEGGEFDGKPYVMSKFYTLSLGEKANLRKDLNSWRGKAFTEQELAGFDLRNILGKACMLSVIEEKGKTKIAAVSALIKGMTVPEQINPSVVFDIDQWEQGIFDGLTDGIKNIIKESDEYKHQHGVPYEREEAPFNPDEDIPF